MTDNTLAADRLRRPDLLTRLVVGVGARRLAWQPRGSLMIKLPNDRRITFGQDRPYDAVLRLKNYRVIAQIAPPWNARLRRRLHCRRYGVLGSAWSVPLLRPQLRRT